ncbi:sigma-70 family RNA polymerase sigma factor [Paenibacillus sp. YYML68]|uniref:sigma-70 family RNA polymerase sigma factor n=1 Tax=Paenibacillus sp. YYML68 TaxID=2909250 RepID=UPI00249189A2|nr:sigma-70 family RNA polymerase sigma factor [Paenibacillus sp. YYML68]
MLNKESLSWAQRFESRDERALEEAIDEWGPSVLALVRRVMSGMGSEEDVEECGSDVFWTAWHHIDRYDADRASFRTWLLLIAKYKALDSRRKLMRQEEERITLREAELIPGGTCTEQRALSREFTQELLACVVKMSEPDRSLFWRRYFYYDSLDELAAMFNLTKKAVEGRLYRCRVMMKQALGLAGADVGGRIDER